VSGLTKKLRDLIIASEMSTADKTAATDLVIEIERRNEKVRESIMAFAREMEGHRSNGEVRTIGRALRRGLEAP